MDPEELDYEAGWAPEDRWGYPIRAAYKLGKCIPIMCEPVGSEVILTACGYFLNGPSLVPVSVKLLIHLHWRRSSR